MFHVVGGSFSTNLIFTIDLMPLNPYFHGVTRRSGAPFWLGNGFPYKPVARSVSGFIASSMRNPSTYGQVRYGLRWPTISSGRNSVSNATNFAFDVGSSLLMNSDS